MLNVEAPGYESEWPDDDNTDERWNGIIQDAVKGFVSSVEASSRQMAQAAERFAADTSGMIDSVAEQVRQTSESAARAAEEATRSAHEARTAMTTVNGAANDAALRIKEESPSSRAQSKKPAAPCNRDSRPSRRLSAPSALQKKPLLPLSAPPQTRVKLPTEQSAPP